MATRLLPPAFSVSPGRPSTTRSVNSETIARSTGTRNPLPMAKEPGTAGALSLVAGSIVVKLERKIREERESILLGLAWGDVQLVVELDGELHVLDEVPADLGGHRGELVVTIVELCPVVSQQWHEIGAVVLLPRVEG